MISARTIVEIIGNVVSIALYLSPLSMIRQIVREKSVGQFTPYSILAALMHSVLWILVSLMEMQHDNSYVTILIVSVVGLIIEQVYLMIYLRFSSSDRQVEVMRYIVAGMILVVFLDGIYPFITVGVYRVLLGVLCVTSGILMYASTLPPLWVAWRDMDVKSLSPPILFAGLLNTALWFTYSLIRPDIYILVQNSIGILLNFVQVIAYFYVRYYGGTVQPPE